MCGLVLMVDVMSWVQIPALVGFNGKPSAVKLNLVCVVRI